MALEALLPQPPHTATASASEFYHHHCSICCLLLPQKLHLKETGLQSEVMAQRGGRADAQAHVRKLQCEVAELADAIGDPKALKDKVCAVAVGPLCVVFFWACLWLWLCVCGCVWASRTCVSVACVVLIIVLQREHVVSA